MMNDELESCLKLLAALLQQYQAAHIFRELRQSGAGLREQFFRHQICTEIFYLLLPCIIIIPICCHSLFFCVVGVFVVVFSVF